MSRSTQDLTMRIRALLDTHPHLADRFTRKLLSVLHSRGMATIDRVHDEARERTGAAPVVREEHDPNIASAAPWQGAEREAVQEVTLAHAARHLAWNEIEDVLNIVRRREEAESLENIASLPDVPFTLLAERVKHFGTLPRGAEKLAPSEVMGVRAGLVRNFISDQTEFIGIAKSFLRIRDYTSLLDRVIGPDKGRGRIGGKAAGMFLGYRILQEAQRESGDHALQLAVPESWYLRSDVIHQFLHRSGLDEYQNQKYKDPEQIRDEYPVIRQLFQNSEFPDVVVRKLERVLADVGTHPLIVRSSSVLEDRFGAAFSGMYASIFLGNQGTPRERLDALIGAIKEVYASTLGPDPLLYRRRHGLVDYNEEMAVLIQKVVGRPHGRFFLPDLAGVAFSRNEYRWSSRIEPEDGMSRVVLGLGTRAVDRTGNDYSRMVALGAPRIRPEVTPEDIRRYSQRMVDVIDLEQNRFRSVPLPELLAEGADVPGLELAASTVVDGTIVEPTGGLAGAAPDELCLTFDRLLSRTGFAGELRERLGRLEQAYGVPINVEFAQDGDRFYLLQCRPLVQSATESVRLPSGVTDEARLFTSRGVVRSGELRDIDHIVYVDPRAYDRVETLERRQQLGRAVGRINDALESSRFILMGPGRWGSVDSRLGVRVSYADINHCKLLIEIAVRKGSYVPEVSYGTHFFQDLVEDGIFYLALYPDDSPPSFNDEFFRDAPNALPDISPRDAALQRWVKVIRIGDAAPRRRAHVVMDGDRGEAICWLE